MCVVTQTIQCRIKDLLCEPSETKAFALLIYIDKHQHEIRRGGLENKVMASIPGHLNAEAIQATCMVIRDMMVTNHKYTRACTDLEIVERALHNQAKLRRQAETQTQSPVLKD